MKSTSAAFKIACAVAAVLAIAGIAAWIHQLSQGLAVTDMSNGTSWGLYITNFMFFVGRSAGGLIVASSASVFHIAEYKKVALPAVIVSTVCIVLAAMFVLIDLGGIQRILNLFIHPNFASPLLWDVVVITLYLVIDIIYLAWLAKGEEKAHAVEVLGRVALPVAILVHSITAWIFGLQIARDGWYSAIMAPLFIVSAMDSGLALLLLSLLGLDKVGWFKTDRKLIASLAGLLCTIVAIDAFMIACEVLTMAYPGADGAAALAIMTSGATAPLFWIEVVAGLVIPFLVLVFAKNREKGTLVAIASALVIIGVFCKRAWLLITSFAGAEVPTTIGTLGGAGTWAGYFPTFVEWVIVIGVIALCVLAFLLLSRRLLKK